MLSWLVWSGTRRAIHEWNDNTTCSDDRIVDDAVECTVTTHQALQHMY